MIRNITTQQLEKDDIIVIGGHYKKTVRDISSINDDDTYTVTWAFNGNEFTENLTYDEKHQLWVD